MTPAQQRSEDFINTAIAISDAVADGANPADPAVIALLQSIQTDFGVDVVAGNDKDEFFFPNGSLFSDEDLTYTNGLGGNDFLAGGRKTDVLVGGEGNDTLFGSAGDDGLFGGSDNDVLNGAGGDDFLRGGTGNDKLFGRNGEDTLEGSAGNDILIGGKGADVFLFDPSNPDLGIDIIKDFELGVDVISLGLADIIASEEGIADMDGDEAFSAADLDASSAWNLVASDDGNVLVEHPGGTIELEGIAFDAALSFAVLVELGAVEVAA